MTAKAYVGYRKAATGEEWAVFSVDSRGRSRKIPLRLDLANHSPDGFAWGYSGSGPAQLALALLAHYTRNDKKALRLYQVFKAAVIAAMDQESDWALTAEDIDRGIAAAEGLVP